MFRNNRDSDLRDSILMYFSTFRTRRPKKSSSRRYQTHCEAGKREDDSPKSYCGLRAGPELFQYCGYIANQDVLSGIYYQDVDFSSAG
jgi:hypothetical protein